MLPLAIRIEGGEPFPILIFIGALVMIITLAIVGHIQEKKRREALQALAQQLGFSFHPDKDHGFASQYGFLNNMDSGSNRYAYNIMQGNGHDGSPCTIFDYHYETHSTDSKGRRKTHHHYYSIYSLILPKQFPEIEIKPEGFFAKLSQALGFDDIDFESMEFSKRYQVKSPDKKFAYDICNAQMINHLLRQRDLVIEIEHNVLALTFKGRLNPSEIRTNLDQLLQIRSLIPNYLFS